MIIWIIWRLFVFDYLIIILIISALIICDYSPLIIWCLFWLFCDELLDDYCDHLSFDYLWLFAFNYLMIILIFSYWIIWWLFGLFELIICDYLKIIRIELFALFDDYLMIIWFPRQQQVGRQALFPKAFAQHCCTSWRWQHAPVVIHQPANFTACC